MTKKFMGDKGRLSDFVPDSANARLHGERNLREIARSLQEFGQHAPLVVQKGTNRILVGNGRYEAMLSLGWTEADVLYVDDDNITAVRRSLADNRTAELATWDHDVLASLLSEIGGDLPGWTDEELEALIGTLNVDHVIPDEEPEYDESVADEVKMITCPECGHEFPA